MRCPCCFPAPKFPEASSFRLYSHAAAGKLRLALYDNAEPKRLVWESGEVANTSAGGEIVVPIATGNPTALQLGPGTYWAAWQTDSAAAVGSLTSGTQGDGFGVEHHFGPAPTELPSTSIVPSAEKWTQYMIYLGDGTHTGWVIF